MAQIQEKAENFTTAVGKDLSNEFEMQVSKTIKNLIESLENHLIDDNTKVDYATHVFAKALDDMVDILNIRLDLESSALLHRRFETIHVLRRRRRVA